MLPRTSWPIRHRCHALKARPAIVELLSATPAAILSYRRPAFSSPIGHPSTLAPFCALSFSLSIYRRQAHPVVQRHIFARFSFPSKTPLVTCTKHSWPSTKSVGSPPPYLTFHPSHARIHSVFSLDISPLQLRIDNRLVDIILL